MEQNQNNHNLKVHHNTVHAATLNSPIDLIKFAVNFYKKNWKNLAIIGIIPQLLISILSIIFGLSNSFDLINFDNSIILSVISIIVILSISLITIFISTIQVVALIKYIHSHNTGTKLSLEDSFKQSFASFWPVVLISLVSGLINVGSMILFVIPGIFVFVASIFYMFTFVIDGKRDFSALIESYRLIRGHWWQVFGRILFFVFCVFVVYVALAIVSIPFAIIGINSTLLSFIAAAFIVPISHIYFYKMYVDLKNSSLKENVPSNYKKWLVTFIVIGILTILVMIVSIAIIATIGLVYQL